MEWLAGSEVTGRGVIGTIMAWLAWRVCRSYGTLKRGYAVTAC